MYRIINEDNSLVSKYPSNVLYGLLSEAEKEYIQICKNEIDKLSQKEGLGKTTVSLSYECNIIEKVFEIKNINGYTIKEFEEIKDKIRDHMADFCKKEKGLYEFYTFAYICSA